MKREWLKQMGIEDEQIELIMAENGRDINSAREKAADSAADGQLGGGEQVAAAEVLREHYEAVIGEMKLAAAIEKALIAAGARNPAVVRAALDMDAISLEDGAVAGLDEQIKRLRETDAYLFADSDATAAPSMKFDFAKSHGERGQVDDRFFAAFAQAAGLTD